MLLIEFKCSILKNFLLEIVHTNCSKMASSLEIKIIGVMLMLKCQPPKISRGRCSRWVTQFLRKTQHLASPWMEFHVKLNNGYHMAHVT